MSIKILRDDIVLPCDMMCGNDVQVVKPMPRGEIHPSKYLDYRVLPCDMCGNDVQVVRPMPRGEISPSKCLEMT